MTPLDKPLKREVQIDEQAYTLTIDPDGLTLVPKGKRKGLALRWADLVSGDAALATARQAALTTRGVRHRVKASRGRAWRARWG